MSHWLLSIFIISAFSCSAQVNNQLLIDKEKYKEEHTIWQNQRIKSLTASEGWLSVVGLHWLKQGKNTLGSSENMDIVLPEFAASTVGHIVFANDSIYFESAGESYSTVEDNHFLSGRMYTDADGKLTKLKHKSLIFYIIKRGEKYGLRIKNTLARARYSLKEIPSYPVNFDLIVQADVKNIASKNENINIEDITGYKQDYLVEAELKFAHAGKKYKLKAFDGGPDYYFVIFKDQTTGLETYGGGRYMYVARPKDGAKTIELDFNKAFNPPCVFTDFATCPIPPQENFLNFNVRAGERKLEDH